MILQAFEDFPQIDREQSFMIGDSLRDVEAGIQAGLRRNILLSNPLSIQNEKLTDLKSSIENITCWQNFTI